MTEKRIPTASAKTFRPPLSWSSQPEGTKSFALTMVDPEARGGQGFVHWVAYGIPVSVTGFAEGELASVRQICRRQKQRRPRNLSGSVHLRGAPHHYTFVLIATHLDPKELPPGLTREDLFPKLIGHTKGATGLVGLFGTP